jgi:hypothetical protein
VLRHPKSDSNSLPAQMATVPSGRAAIETAPVRASAQAGIAGPGLLPLVFALVCLVPMWITARQRPRQNRCLGRRVDSGSRPGISPRLVYHHGRDATFPPSSHPLRHRSPSDTPPCPEHGHPGVRDRERRAGRGLPAPTVAPFLLPARTQLESRPEASRRGRIAKVGKAPSSQEIAL